MQGGWQSRWMPARAAERSRGTAAAAMLVLVFALLGLSTRLLCADADGYSSFWPANAALVVALLTLRAAYAAPVVAACFCLNLALNRLSLLAADESLQACVLNVVEAILVAIAARRFCGALTDLTRFRRLATFALVVGAATGLCAGIGVAVEALFMNDSGNIVGDWSQWVLCDALGLLTATPTLLLAVRRIGARRLPSALPAEPLLLLMLTLGLTLVGFLSPRSFLFLLLYPAMVALAFRAPPAWVLTTVLMVSIFVSAMTAHGLGPIAFLSPDGPMMRENMLQPYLLSLFLSALPANNALGDKRRTARRLGRMRANLEHAATHDAMTGLMNRQLFRRRLSACAASGVGGTVLFIDLDHFKRVNDTYGHQAGDLVLQMFACRMAEHARGLTGEAARLGGDEFAMLLARDLGTAELDAVCAAILQAARVPYSTGTETVLVTVSIGAATLRLTRNDPDSVARAADLALYAAKDAGRDAYRLSGPLFGPPPPRPGDVPVGDVPVGGEGCYPAIARDAATMPTTIASGGAFQRSRTSRPMPTISASVQAATLPVQSGS